MVHLQVMVLFVSTICGSLIGYEKFMYAWVVLLFGTCCIAHRILFVCEKPLRHLVLSVLCAFIFIQYAHATAVTQRQEYRTGFVLQSGAVGEMRGRIEEFPNYRFAGNQYIVRLENSSTRILVPTQPYQKFDYLDQVVLSGKFEDVRDQGAEWQGYYQKLGVHYGVWNPEVTPFENTEELVWQQKVLKGLFQFKMAIRYEAIRQFSSHASALFLGMLLGEKDELSKLEKEMFNQVGLSHILVVSGYNISLLISFMFLVLKFANRNIRIACSLTLIFLFVLLVGADGSVVRAALMGSIIIFAKVTHRTSSALNVLFLAAFCMIAINPLSVFDAGLHLSFVATFALLIMPVFKRIPEFVMTTVWVFLFVSPYIVYLSGYVSMGGIFSNLLVVFLLPVFMMISLVSLCGFALQTTLRIDSLVLDILSRYVFLIAEISQNIPRAEFKMSPLGTVTFYCAVFSLVLFFKNRYSTSEFIERRYRISSQLRSS